MMPDEQARRLLPILRRLAKKHRPPAGMSHDDLASAAAERVVKDSKNLPYPISLAWIVYRADRAMVDEIRRMRPGGRTNPGDPTVPYLEELDTRTDPEPADEKRVRKDQPAPTQRQRDVLRLASQGAGQDETARELGISVETVKTARRAILVRLASRTIAQAVGKAIRRGYIR